MNSDTYPGFPILTGAENLELPDQLHSNTNTGLLINIRNLDKHYNANSADVVAASVIKRND
jgi:hypothetical protein